MKHFLRISYNVFRFRWEGIKFNTALFLLIGLIIFFITKEIEPIFVWTFCGLNGGFWAAYIMEQKRYKQKGHY